MCLFTVLCYDATAACENLEIAATSVPLKEQNKSQGPLLENKTDVWQSACEDPRRLI